MNIINDIERNEDHGKRQRQNSANLLMDRVHEGVDKVIRKYFDDATFVSSKLAAIDVANSLSKYELAKEMESDLSEVLEPAAIDVPFHQNKVRS